MFSNWTSLEDEIRAEVGHESVLSEFPVAVGLEVAGSVVHNLAQSVGKSSENGEKSGLKTDAHVQWALQVLCHGLTLPFSSGNETIKDCVNVYCDWLICLTDPTRPSIPRPIADDVNTYTKIMMQHLSNVFTPRPDANLDLVNRQTILCHRVLRAVQYNVEKTTALTADTWDHVLKFLLKITDGLLSPPLEKDSIGSNLCERVLGVLFELWILACLHHFPSPPMWKTLRQLCAGWRHHEALVAQWQRVITAFTARLLSLVYGNNFHKTSQIGEEEEKLIPERMDSERVVQCWFRFLHILGNPADLSRPRIISSTQKFLHVALTSDQVIDPHQHDCLKALPIIFYRAMRAVSSLVDFFLRLNARDHTADSDWLAAVAALRPTTQQLPPAVQQSATTTPPATRKARPSILVPHSKANKENLQSRLTVDNSSTGINASNQSTGIAADKTLLSPCRATVNSLLHLVGSWLLEASLVGVRVHGGHSNVEEEEGVAYECGRAQACGALCRIFSSHRTQEDILPVYTSRFYISMFYALHVDQDTRSIPIVLSSVIKNGQDLMRVDLDGVQVLLPRLLHALQAMQPLFKYKQDGLDEDVELRRSSIQLLLSMLCVPLHFGKLQICTILEDEFASTKPTFISLRGPMTELLIKLLTNETDSTNTQMLLGGLVVCITDLSLYEQNTSHAESGINPILPYEVKLLLCQERLPALKMRHIVSISAILDYPCLRGINEDKTAVYTSQELFGQITSLVCQRLQSTWKTDLGTALASLEVLSALTRVRMARPNSLMCKRTVNWICEFVVYQCLRPAPSHSKDLHSMIVAAFQCLTTWLLVHDYLMQDQECIQTVLQVVELGISGFKPQRKSTEVSHYKGEKELKPVSMRVRDAAEALVTVIIDYVGCFPPPCAPESLCTLLDEESLMKQCKQRNLGVGRGGRVGDELPLLDDELPFQYYVLDGSTIVALLEQPVNSEMESLPTVTALVRGSFGRHAWTMQLRHQPRNTSVPGLKVIDGLAAVSQAASVDQAPPPVPAPIQHQYFPDIVDQIPKVLADLSIPKLENTMIDNREELSKLESILNQQIEFEEKCRKRRLAQAKPLPKCTEPKPSDNIQTARLFLSHYGFLTLEGLRAGVMNSMPPSLVRLNTNRESRRDLLNDLKQLDSLPVRTADSVQIFYMRTGQSKLSDILNNVTRQDYVQEQFLEFIRSLGWPVDVNKHAGWTGSVSSSWKIKPASSPTDDDSSTEVGTGGSAYDGRRHVIYWSDISSEVVFIVPSPASCSANQNTDSAPGGDAGGTNLEFSKSQTISLDLDTSDSFDASSALETPTSGISSGISSSGISGPGISGVGISTASTTNVARLRRSGRSGVGMVGADVQVVIVWLESFEDYAKFPVADLVKSSLGNPSVNQTSSANQKQTPPHFCIIYIHPLHTGLYRIHMQSQQTRESEAVPLVEGMVISHRLLGHLVRQTSVNIFRRRQLDSELYQPPHVRRKLKIKDIVEKHRIQMDEPDFYVSLFNRDNSNTSQV